MDAIVCRGNGQIETLDEAVALPETGFLWVDFCREADPSWQPLVEKLSGTTLHEEHVRDALNTRHPSSCEIADDYEIIIFHGLAPNEQVRSGPSALITRPTAFFLFPRLLVTVRPSDAVSVDLVKGHLRSGRKSRAPERPVDLAILVMSAMVDRYLALREGLAEELADWQDKLLDDEDPFEEWTELMRARNRLRRFAVACEGQEDTLLLWREETEQTIAGSLEVRFNDLLEHVRRVKQELKDLQNDIEALVQIHFSAVANRTNRIVRVLTVFTAVFLPLHLIAGIFGMNFAHLPGLDSRYAFLVTLGIMVILVVSLLAWFRHKRWL